MNWNEFEIKCTSYLNKKFGKYAKFTHIGGSNSTKSDIWVKTQKGDTFYIEIKHIPAQCGQFVLLPNLETMSFRYSDKNATSKNKYSEIIINHMDNNFEEYRNAGTAGKKIEFKDCEDIFTQWIIDYYKSKGTKFFIINNYLLLPIEKLNDYFTITATYRIKRSGSSPVGKNNIKLVRNFISQNYPIQTIQEDEEKLFITSTHNLHNTRFFINAVEYMFSLRKNQFEIRRLSNTYNANVIFSINVKDDITGISDDEFKKILI